MDWRWALLSPWKWAIGVLTAAIGFLAGVGIVAGGIVDNPLWLVDTMTKYGLWQWYSVVWALVSAWRTWHCGRLYYAVPLRPAQDGTAVGGTERQEISTVAR